MSDHLHALPAGHCLGEYRIERVIGSGGFGITYYALDIHLNKPVAIKEYIPNEFALRANATTVRPKSSADQDNYQWGLERFLDEARALARFDHPHLNKVHRFFEDNGTAYIVLEYIEGETLSQILKRDGRMDAPRLRRMLDELLSGLDEVHRASYVHRDIKPGNIMLRPDGSAVLLDFGAARQAVGQRSKSITSILTPGYAPIEQYDQKAEDVGPWSDFYALGMVAYRCITGIGDGEIPDAVARSRLERKGEADLAPAVEVGKGRYDKPLLQAVDWITRVDENQRPRSVAALREVLAGGTPEEVGHATPPSAGVTAPSGPPTSAPTKGKDAKEKSWGASPISVILLLVLVFGAALVTATVNYWPHLQERQRWQTVDCNDESSLRDYLQAYPNGRYESEAQGCFAKMEERGYWRAVDCNDDSSLRSYLQTYPSGRYKSEARGCLAAIEEREWQAVNCDDRGLVQGYMRAYPDGRYKSKARSCLTAIEKREAKEKREAEEKRKADEEARRKAIAQQPGRRFRDCEDCPEMVIVPAGSFMMGSPTSEEGRFDREEPQHQVTVGKFVVGRYEVTFDEWEACRRAGDCSHDPDDEGWGKGNRPVINISWDDAKEYVRWLSKKTGKRYRLLSESEWEYVARAGTTTPFHTGQTISIDQAQHNDGNYGVSSRRKTAAVGSYPANQFGLQDMHGNVWEWVEDCWHDNYEEAPSNGSAWTTGDDCANRVLRGGSWVVEPRFLRAANRNRISDVLRLGHVGFRVARALTP